MKLRVAAIVVGAAAVAMLATSPANALSGKSYDHKDPYTSGCGNSARVVKTATLNSAANGNVGSIKLMWSGTCQTNWIEISTVSTGNGNINVYAADGRTDTFAYAAGNGGRHWGNMLWANNMCAWGGASVRWGGGGGGQNGSGMTAKACG